MRINGKIIIGDNNGIGEECNGYDLRKIYEGEFLKGKRNGKGKEYEENRILIYEGEYKNGIINGKGKVY